MGGFEVLEVIEVMGGRLGRELRRANTWHWKHPIHLQELLTVPHAPRVDPP